MATRQTCTRHTTCSPCTLCHFVPRLLDLNEHVHDCGVALQDAVFGCDLQVPQGPVEQPNDLEHLFIEGKFFVLLRVHILQPGDFCQMGDSVLGAQCSIWISLPNDVALHDAPRLVGQVDDCRLGPPLQHGYSRKQPLWMSLTQLRKHFGKATNNELQHTQFCFLLCF